MFGFLKSLTGDCYPQYKNYADKMGDFLPSSLYFPSLLAWDFANKNYYQVIGEYFCIVVVDRLKHQIHLFAPVGNYRQDSFGEMMNILFTQYERFTDRLVFSDVTEDKLPFFKGLKGFYIDKLASDRGNADYVYTRDDFLKSLNEPQARYNRNYFIRRNNPAWAPITSESKEDCCILTEESFCKVHSCHDCKYGCEKELIKILLNHYENIGAEGIVVKVENRAAGFGIAGKQGKTMAYLFKKNVRSLRGINEYLHYVMLEQFGRESSLVNYTEDMDIPGLRNFKMRLSPFHLNLRYEITVRRGDNRNER